MATPSGVYMVGLCKRIAIGVIVISRSTCTLQKVVEVLEQFRLQQGGMHMS